MVGRIARATATAIVLNVMAALGVRASDLPLIEFPVKPAAPGLMLDRLDGGTFDLAALRGKVVVINFWATWCAPCRREMPALQRAWEKLSGEGVTVIAVNLGEPASRVRQFLSRTSIRLPVALDPTSSSYSSWQLQGLPTTYIVGPDGRIHYGAIGDREWDSPAILAPILALTRPLRPLPASN